MANLPNDLCDVTVSAEVQLGLAHVAPVRTKSRALGVPPHVCVFGFLFLFSYLSKISLTGGNLDTKYPVVFRNHAPPCSVPPYAYSIDNATLSS